MRALFVVPVAITLGLLAASCDSGSSSPQADPVPSPTDSQIGYGCGQALDCAGEIGSPAGPVVIPHAVRGGTVTVLTHAGLASTLDPREASTPEAISIDSGLLTRSLTQYRIDPSLGLMLVPDLATDEGVHNDDYTEWKYVVRPGVRFDNGQPVTARDVARGIRGCLDSVSFPTGLCQEDLAPYLRSLRVKRNILTFDFNQPFPDLPYLAALPAFGPVPAGKDADPQTYRLHPWATGPYRIESHHPDELVLTRNPEWDPASDPGRTQYPDRYVFRSGQTASQIDRVLLSASGARTLTFDDVALRHLNELREAGRVVSGSDNCLTYWAPDNRTITDRRVRVALAWAFPYRRMLLIEGLIPDVTAVPARSIQPPGMPGGLIEAAHLPGPTSQVLADHDHFQTSPSRARALLVEAHALGQPIRFAYSPGDRTSRQTKQAWVRALRAAGFTPRPESTGPGGLAGFPTPSVDVRTATWCGDYPAGGAFLPALLSTTPRNGSGALGTNLSAFSQPSIDRQIRQVRAFPLDQQPRHWNDLDRTAMQRWFPLVPLWYGGVAMAHGDDIQGMVDDTVHGMPDWKGLWVSPPA